MPYEIVEALEALVSELSPIANELYEKVEVLAETAESVDNDLERSVLIEGITEQLNLACKVITRLQGAFSSTNENGTTFIEMLDKCYGVGTIGITEGDFETLLNSEANRLDGIGLNEVVIDLVLHQMQEAKKKLMSDQPMEDANNILNVIDTTQKRICHVAEQGNEFVNSSPIPYLRAAAGCVINVCVVTGDALTPFVVQDPTLKSYAIAVKSVYSGYNKLKEHGRKLLEGIQAFRRRRLRNYQFRNREND
ncbi:MAG: hypothetical protein AB2692_18785 [Candidatus Thiodiazotropha sp.]